MPTASPFYFDWQFWSAIVAVVALVLSQFPPVILWFRPRRLEVEVHSRILVLHKFGNLNAAMYTSLRNTGGRELRVRDLTLTLSRDGRPLGSYPAQNYYETPSATTPVLFVPFSLQPGQSWAYNTVFLNSFDRATDKLVRESEAALREDIKQKLQARAPDDKSMVVADPSLVAPFEELFERLFPWQPGEYIAQLNVKVEPGSASFQQRYRFTLYESDTAQLRSHVEDYKYGGGVSYDNDRHVGIPVPISRHVE